MNNNTFQEIKNTFKYENGVTIITPHTELHDIQSIVLKRREMEKLLQENGALLFRNFHIDSPEKFKNLASAFADDLMSDNGEHNPLSSIDKVYTPVTYSPREKLLWHNENSFNQRWPLMIMFGCLTPATAGGETLIVDGRKILTAIDPEVLREFSQKGVTYVRTHGFGFGRSWQDTYQTQNKKQLEEICKKCHTEFEWHGDKLITKQTRPAIVKHPETSVLSWFNQAQHWHPYCLKPEVREYFLETFAETELPRNCHFGDGSIISDDIMKHIMEVYQKLEVGFPWQKGDAMVLDNVLFAHARNSYSGERKLLVTMGKHATFLEKIGPESHRI